MAPEIGQFALILALFLAGTQSVLPMLGAARGNRQWMASAVAAAQAQLLFVAIAFACLAYSFVTNDFSVLNVVSNSNSQLPIPYRFAATWGSHEGSLLLWVLILGVWTAAVAKLCREVTEEMLARVLSVMGMISVGFLLLLLVTSNPFVRLHSIPMDGQDLNPVLQDPAMVAHPPMLYMGYVGFSVAFAFAVAALVGGRVDTNWARWSRPWTTAAWVFLTCGIALGSYWAYYELGWGGWWFWDPVENASFMPWLVATALLHSLAVTEKRGAFKSWTVLLAIGTFSLSLLGTFLVRSGVLTSVHAFASDPKRGLAILCFLGIVIGGSLFLYAMRAKQMTPGSGFGLLSRESLLLTNNLALSVAAGSVLLGTLYPLLMDALNAGKLSVGPPYFNAVFPAIMAPAMFLLGIAPVIRWRRATMPEIVQRLRWAFATSVVTGLLVPIVTRQWKPLTDLGVLLAVWIALSVLFDVGRRIRSEQLRRFSGSYWAMQLAHIGVAVSLAGITVVTGYESEKDVKVNVGDAVVNAGYGFRFLGVTNSAGPNYQAARAGIEVVRDGRLIGRMYPEKRIYNVSEDAVTATAIDSGFTRDLYVSMGEPVGSNGSWSMRVYYKPFVNWIWGGAVLMAAGGVLAILERRRKSVQGAGTGEAR